MIGGGYCPRFDLSKRGVIARAYGIRAIGDIPLTIGGYCCASFAPIQLGAVTGLPASTTPKNILSALREHNCTSLS